MSLFRSSIDGLVPYEPGKPVEEVQRELGLEHVVKLASNEGPFPPFPAALEAMERASLELNRYPDGGAWALRAALAERSGVAFEELIVGAGADGIIDLLSQATLDPGDDVVCGWPSFPSYVLDAAKLGAEARRVPLRDQTYDLDGLLAAIGPRTKLV
ncbi:MAG TPA: aminotransferase class I/II-fold pyridoxal phosphate-dependent enzyme, partial [Gaiellaceae bacterium]|nr:aminotransferase class I/II-fold pyridoxal phosphate-dependent enzyme [Gaiellaceae bacterium]